MPRPGSTAARGYGAEYKAARRRILGPAGGGILAIDPPCHWKGKHCAGVATTADHDPPIAEAGSPHLNLVPACAPCNYGRRVQPHTATAPPSRAW